MKQHYKLLLSLILGAVVGIALHPFAQVEWLTSLNSNFLQPVGQIFLRLIFMIVVPMVFSALVLGVFELGKGHSLGKTAVRTLAFTIVASTCSVLIGISLVNFVKPGAGFPIDPNLISDQQTTLSTILKNSSEAKSVSQSLVDLIPKNPLESATKALSGEMLSLMVFALIFGVALSLVSAKKRLDHNPITALLEQIFAVCMRIVDFAMTLAPFGVFAIVFNTTFKYGHGFLGSLAMYVCVVVAGLLIQQFVVYSTLLKFVARRSPLDFFRKCREVYIYAFSTASSNATLPTALEAAERDLKLHPEISRFVLTIGSTANQNGTALFEGITVLFLAQVYGIDLTFAQQTQVVFMSILAGIGTAGVPGGSLPLIMILLQQVGIPAEGLGLILGADRFLDMCRTTLNVSGDLVIAALVDGNTERN